LQPKDYDKECTLVRCKFNVCSVNLFIQNFDSSRLGFEGLEIGGRKLKEFVSLLSFSSIRFASLKSLSVTCLCTGPEIDSVKISAAL